MKVLWVCNIMLPEIAAYLGKGGSNKEGWLSGLCDSILKKQQENGIELHVAFPVERELDGYAEKMTLKEGTLWGYGFYEDVNHAEVYDPELEQRIHRIAEKVQPDVIHCFGTEFAHTLAVLKSVPYPERVLVGIQGVCGVIAEAYMADLPERVQKKSTFRDWLKQDSLLRQQQKFFLRGQREKEILKRASHITGRTEFDRKYALEQNPQAHYYSMNETLRSCFYEDMWRRENCEPHTIFLSQGDYPLKGLHYMLLASVKLREKYPDLKIKVAGNSLVNYDTLKNKIKISAYGKYLRSLIKEHCLEDMVSFLGRLSAEEMKSQFLRSGLYVCCSSNENSPNSLGEAMLLGLPCVAAAVGGIPDLFEDGIDGILYEGSCRKKDAINNACDCKKQVNHSNLDTVSDRLYQGIDKMWTEQEKIESYCQNARLHARKTHDSEENYRKLTEIYAEIKE